MACEFIGSRDNQTLTTDRFRWVACQMDYLCECTNDRERREALDKLPPDLPSSYERILERINNSPNKSNQRLVARALEWIMFARQPLQTQELLEALAINEGDDDIYPDARTTEDEILHWGSSLLRRRKDEGLELAHFTVAEFLQSLDCYNNPQPQFKPYSTCRECANIKHAISCLTYLTAKTFSNIQLRDRAEISTISEKHRFLSYAAKYWVHHAHDHMDLPCIQNLTHRLYDPASTNQLAVQSSPQIYSPLSVAVIFADEDMWSVLLAAGAKFSAFDCKAIEVLAQPHSMELRGKIFTYAAKGISIVQPEAHCVLFETAFESFVFGREDCGEAPKLVLQNLSSHSDAFEWANSLTLKFKNQVDYASLQDKFVYFYCLLESMQEDLQSTAPFPSWLRELVVCAVREGKVEFMNSLLEGVPSICFSFEDGGETLLHTAVLNLDLQGIGNDTVMVELLLRAGLKSCPRNLRGETPLHYAAKLGRLDVFELLITSSDAGNALDLQDQEGRTAYDWASVYSHTSIVEFINQYRQSSRIPAEMEDVQMPGPRRSEGEHAETCLKRMPSIEEDEETSSTKRQKNTLSAVRV
jgi:hypothetical protein